MSRFVEEAALLDQRRRAHGGSAGRQLAQEIVVGECRPLGRELLIRAILSGRAAARPSSAVLRSSRRGRTPS